MNPEQFSPEHFGWHFAGGVATVTLNRPERKNPLTFESYAELRDTFRALAYAPAVKAVIVTGAGGNFSSGGDVHEIIGPLTEMAMPELLAFTRMTGDLVKAMRACPQPIVAAIDGICVGAGAIMAMAQWPTYNPNDRTDMAPDRWRNLMVSDVYDPGSTMKCIAIAGAIDYGIVDLETAFDCEHGLWYYCRTALHDSHGHGTLNVSDIICKSSNIGPAKIGVAMGKNRLFQTFRRFGFGKPTGIGFDDESAGLLSRPAKWDCLGSAATPRLNL